MMLAYQYVHPYYHENDIGYIETTEIGANIPPALPSNLKFDITSAMIQLLNLKVAFLGSDIVNRNMYLSNFVGIYTFYAIQEVDQEALRLRLCPFSLIEEASL